MTRQRINQEDVKIVLKALLLTEKEAIRTGVPIAHLDNDFYNSEGIRIPFRQLGYSCLLDFLQTLTDTLILKCRNGFYVAFPIVDENTQHVFELVANQKSAAKKPPRGGYRHSRYSRPYQELRFQPPVRVDSQTFTEIVTMVKNTPNGIWLTRIIEYANHRMNCNVDAHDLCQQLSNISHEVIMYNDAVFPIEHCHSEEISFSQPQANYDPPMSPPLKQDSHTIMGPAGDTDCESENGFVPHTASQSQDNNEEPQENDGQTAKTFCHDDCHDFDDEKTMRDIVSERTKLRLQNLILKYPDGIWCADLPKLYEDEYTISLDYKELGFYSVLSFAYYLSDIFHCVQPQDKGDYKLYDARAEKPDVKQTKKRVTTTLAALHNVYELNDDIPEPIPTLSKEIANRIIPDGVMTIGETIAQICVTELDRSPHHTIEVVVVELFTPSFFWIQLLKKMTNFKLFMKKLHEFYEKDPDKYLMAPAIMAKGLNCACKYENQWHRGIITNITVDLNVTVLFYDYGTRGTYEPDCIHYLHRSFSNLPAQAIPCGLYNIKPVRTPKWSTNVTCEFANKVSTNPLIARIAQIDTENNSMLIILTDTTEKEDLHINDWLVHNGYAQYGKMGETVQLNDTAYDEPIETTSRESTFQAADHKSPGMTLNTIEEDANSRSMNTSPVDNELAYSQFLNSKALLAINWFIAEIKECNQRGITVDAKVLEKIEWLKNWKTTETPGCSASSIGSDDESTSRTPVLKTKEFEANEDLAVEPTVPSTSNYSSPINTKTELYTNVQGTLSYDLTHDINMNVSLKPCLEDSTSTSEIAFAPPKYENADDHISNELYKTKLTTDAFSHTIASEYSSIVSPDYPVEEVRTTTVTARKLLENSLLQSANDFFQRMKITTRATPNLESSNNQLDSTNPFKKEIEEANATNRSPSMPLLPSKNSLRRPHGAMNAQIENQSPETKPTRVTYEHAPVYYGVNVHSRIENNGNRTTNESYAYACEKSDVVGERGSTGSTSSVSKTISPSLSRVDPPRVVDSNGYETSLIQSSWDQAITNASDFKNSEEILRNKEIHKKCSSRLTEKTLTQDDSRENPNWWEIPLTKHKIYLLKYEGEGWVALEEFAAFINTSPNVIVQSVPPENISVTFRSIRRYDNIQLFQSLDGSSLNVPRDYNNSIGPALELTSLAYVLYILKNVKLVTKEQIYEAKNGRIYPEYSSLLQDVSTLIATSGTYINAR